MTPHRAGTRGTFIIDRRTRVGRIAVASGTNHAPTFRRLNEMITSLNETGRGDLLRDLRDGRRKPLEVYEAFRANELHKLPTGVEMQPLDSALKAWYETLECSEQQKAIHRMVRKRLGKKDAVVSDLPALLTVLRESYRKAKHPASFNRLRASVLAFVRDTLRRSHRLYGEVRDVAVMKEKKAPLKQPQTWAQIMAHSEKMTEPWHNAALWGMALTGMGPKEYYIDGWRVERNRVVILGEKRKDRKRVVPAVWTGYYTANAALTTPVSRAREMRVFGEKLFERCGIHTYDLRRTYANWLESAGVPRTRRKMYMGHAGGDVTSLYERHEVEQFLAEDAKRIEAFLAQAPITTPITKTLELHG